MRNAGRGRGRSVARYSVGFRHLVWPVAMLAALLPIAVTLAAEPAAGTLVKVVPPERAYSAYGLQLSIPKSWTTEYFASCAHHGVGTLIIGTPSTIAYCALYSQSSNIVTMQPEKSEAVEGTDEKNLVVHGLHVTSYLVGGTLNWDVRSKSVVISATGPGSRSVLRTLTTATPRALAAPGVLKGSEYLEALERVSVTGLVSVLRLDAHAHAHAHAPALPAVHAYDGQFSATLSPGRYRLTGHDGNAPCPRLTVTVQSGQVVNIPSIDCQGE
jgi:hypothetical protein